jgi:hypothetical protein
MTTALECPDEIEVRLTGRGLWITRLALVELMAMSTREEHVYHDIRAALAKLPEAREPGSSNCEYG